MDVRVSNGSSIDDLMDGMHDMSTFAVNIMDVTVPISECSVKLNHINLFGCILEAKYDGPECTGRCNLLITDGISIIEVIIYDPPQAKSKDLTKAIHQSILIIGGTPGGNAVSGQVHVR